MTTQLKLYTNPMSRGQIAHWMMEELGLPYETEWVDYGPQGLKSESFLKINPMGKLPVVIHNDQTITECAAICAYAAELDPSGKLKPSAAMLAPYYRWLFFAAGPLEYAITNRSLGWDVPENKRKSVGYGSYDEAVSAIENHLKSHDFVCGNQFTAADVYVGSHIVWGMQFETLPELAAFKSYRDRLVDRDAYQRCKKINENRQG